ncbi:hypothetical protein BKA57DRAFT_282650 [Linnemannia elongata]|nr:hypothetical protein BKA57DRAFT_282650 [Linnemannia elongata]
MLLARAGYSSAAGTTTAAAFGLGGARQRLVLLTTIRSRTTTTTIINARLPLSRSAPLQRDRSHQTRFLSSSAYLMSSDRPPPKETSFFASSQHQNGQDPTGRSSNTNPKEACENKVAGRSTSDKNNNGQGSSSEEQIPFEERILSTYHLKATKAIDTSPPPLFLYLSSPFFISPLPLSHLHPFFFVGYYNLYRSFILYLHYFLCLLSSISFKWDPSSHTDKHLSRRRRRRRYSTTSVSQWTPVA